jgi:Uma2 family endonuclease
MTAVTPALPPTNPFYPSSDGEPMAETSIHIDAIIAIIVALRQYLGEQAIVLTNQFLYYAQGFPRLRVAPDCMVIFGVNVGPRDNYKMWEEGQVPGVIFEVTSEGTQSQDQIFKKTLYEQLGVQEYWLFDPRAEWIPDQLQGYRLRGEVYELIQDNCSETLQLQLQVEGTLLGFYRLGSGEKLLIPDELATALRREMEARQQVEAQLELERKRAEQAEQQVERLKARLRELGIENGEL